MTTEDLLEELISSGINAYKKLKNKVLSLSKNGEVETSVFNEYKNKFVSFLEDDINTANAISVIYDVLKAETNDLTKYELIKDFDISFTKAFCGDK